MYDLDKIKEYRNKYGAIVLYFSDNSDYFKTFVREYDYPVWDVDNMWKIYYEKHGNAAINIKKSGLEHCHLSYYQETGYRIFNHYEFILPKIKVPANNILALLKE